MMKGFLKRLLGKRDSITEQIVGPVVGDQTVLASPCADSQPRVRQEGSREWDRMGPSQGDGGTSPGGGDRRPSARDGPTPGIRYHEGDRIGGRYEVLDIFGGPGKSGMGVVYKCFDRWDRRPCALKSFQDQPVWSSEATETFQREAKLWIGVGHHPHIVAARTIRKPDGRLYLVLEYIAPDSEGRNCLTHYLTGHPLPVEQILTWAVQFCWGMEHAMKNGIQSHRDVKPDNIMIDGEGCLKVTDFGLAKSLDGLSHLPGQAVVPGMAQTLSLVATEKGSMCGSPPWMSPEQFGRADEADVRSDVYSFGVVL